MLQVNAALSVVRRNGASGSGAAGPASPRNDPGYPQSACAHGHKLVASRPSGQPRCACRATDGCASSLRVAMLHVRAPHLHACRRACARRRPLSIPARRGLGSAASDAGVSPASKLDGLASRLQAAKNRHSLPKGLSAVHGIRQAHPASDSYAPLLTPAVPRDKNVKILAWMCSAP